MKIVRFLQDTAKSAHSAPSYGELLPDGKVRPLKGDPLAGPGGFVPGGEPVTPARLLAPVQPVQIWCLGLNYRRHAEETGAKLPEHPIIFAKGINTVQDPGAPIAIPRHLPSEEVDYECELAVVIGRTGKNISRKDALSYVLGYTCANDVSARDWQIRRGGKQWCRAKSFDTFCPLGPCLVTTDEIPDPNRLAIRTRLNGEVMQEARTDDMIFDVPAIIEFLSGSATLRAGTVILTGTPHGVGMARNPPRWLKPGDTVEIEIEKIGSLVNPVELER